MADVVVQGTLRRNEEQSRRLLLSMAELCTKGVAVRWESLFEGARRVALPTYAFQRQSFWVSGERVEHEVPRPVGTPTVEPVETHVERTAKRLAEQDLWTLVRSHSAAVLGLATPRRSAPTARSRNSASTR